MKCWLPIKNKTLLKLGVNRDIAKFYFVQNKKKMSNSEILLPLNFIDKMIIGAPELNRHFERDI